MINILDKIIDVKKKELEKNKGLYPIKKLEKSVFFNRKIISLKKKIQKKKNIFIIAEFKLKSPSKGIINNSITLKNVIKGYEKAGVSGISILTDHYFFSGSKNHLTESRFLVSIPLLRKDFIIDEYQIIESKSIGSDIILLISRILSKEKIKKFSSLAKKLGLEILLEIHDEMEIEKINENIDFIGINNRDLKSFNVDFKKCSKICSLIPKNYIKISESGINDIKQIFELKKIGFQGFLIGEYFMRNKNPGNFCKNFLNYLNDQ